MLAYAGINVRCVVTGFLVKETCAVIDAPAFFVRSTVVDTPDTGKGEGRSAHGAGFQGYIKVATGEPL